MASIISDKYKGKKFDKDWLAQLLDTNATKTKEVTVKRPNPDNPEEKLSVTETRADGVDGTKLMALGRENGVDLSKLEGKEDTHGFAGRARMTIRNMLQTVAKQRHGINVNGTFVSAPADWLALKGAPAEPTHTQDGTKIAKAAPAAAEGETAAPAKKTKGKAPEPA